MTSTWNRYTELIVELQALEGQVASDLSVADRQLQRELRQIEDDLTRSDRELHALRGRNSRLQEDVRRLCRAEAVEPGTSSGDAMLKLDSIPEQLRSLEYDLTQLRATLDALAREEARPTPPNIRPPSPNPPPAIPEPVPRTGDAVTHSLEARAGVVPEATQARGGRGISGSVIALGAVIVVIAVLLLAF